jgi:hypothetical protein
MKQSISWMPYAPKWESQEKEREIYVLAQKMNIIS